MRSNARRHATLTLLLAVPLAAACSDEATMPTLLEGVEASESRLGPGGRRSFAVSGNATHSLSTGVVHSQEPVAGGMIQRSTETVRLTGDLEGYVVYHVTGEFDFGAQTLVNTGTQIFSGRVAGSEPVILHDDSFRFDVDLASGEATGEVHLRRSRDAPDRNRWFRCDLVVTVTGVTPEGDNLSEYRGTCSRRGRG